METTMSMNRIATQEDCFDAPGTDRDCDADAGDSVRDAYEFLGTVGCGRDRARSLAVDMIELS
jgi:hypothetical protein